MSLLINYIKVPARSEEIEAVIGEMKPAKTNPGEDIVRELARSVLGKFQGKTVSVSAAVSQIAVQTLTVCDQRENLPFIEVWPIMGRVVNRVLKKHFLTAVPCEIRLSDSCDELKKSLRESAYWEPVESYLQIQGFPGVDRVIEAAATSLSYLLGGTLPLQKGLKEMQEAVVKICPNDRDVKEFLLLVLPRLTDAVVTSLAV